jgi:hypothetical protein
MSDGPQPKKEARPAKAGQKNLDDLTSFYPRKGRREEQLLFVGEKQSLYHYPHWPVSSWTALLCETLRIVEEKT